MNHTQPAPSVRTATRTPARPGSRPVALCLLLLAAAVAVTLGQRVGPSLPSTVSTPFDVFLGDDRDDRGALGEAGGVVPDGVTVFDDDYPAVAHLDAALLRALRDAADDAAGAGIEFHLNSGWRSEAYQGQLLDDAVAEYGSREEAARWVATPETSAHVSGDAVDLAPPAAAWLADHGAPYGLCQIYGNEPWHYELRPEASQIGCPRPYADPTQDPRLQR